MVTMGWVDDTVVRMGWLDNPVVKEKFKKRLIIQSTSVRKNEF